MTSGRETAEVALKPALAARGWNPRASGRFTKEIRPGITAVIAVSAACKHHAPGSASVTMMVGLRDDATEEIVERLSGSWTPRYMGRTWVTPLGYLLSEHDYLDGERVFNEGNAVTHAEELADLLVHQVEPRLRRIADDASEFTALAERSTCSMGPDGLCRIATMLARTQGPEVASTYVADRLTSLGQRTDPAADLERGMAARVMAALTAE
ncbi:hypothetical protein ABZX12_24310 [Kribbella sp. NPDC003505]|uniref:hypothetical protein n=1 Tax=Kribbella sp. NPDC003505 TaxID=3154448 RepID=UPI0033BD6382